MDTLTQKLEILQNKVYKVVKFLFPSIILQSIETYKVYIVANGEKVRGQP